MQGAAFHVYRSVVPHWTPLKNIFLVAVIVGLWVLIPPLVFQPDVLAGPLVQLKSWLGEGPLSNGIQAGVREFAERQFEFVLFPATVMTLALSETVWKRVPWAWLHEPGNWSYGIYLLHFPLQLAVISIALTFNFPTDFFTKTVALVLFLALLIALAAVSYRWFEMPAMATIRRVFLQKRAKAAPDTVSMPTAPAANPRLIE